MTSASTPTADPTTRFAIVGLIAWAVATAAIRLPPASIAARLAPWSDAAFLVLVAAAGATAWVMLRAVASADRVRAMAGFVLPGMVGELRDDRGVPDRVPRPARRRRRRVRRPDAARLRDHAHRRARLFLASSNPSRVCVRPPR